MEAPTPDLAPLADLLGVSTERIATLRAYDDAQVKVLEDAFREAVAAEDAGFTRASEDALRFVPRLLRGPAKRMMGGGRRG